MRSRSIQGHLISGTAIQGQSTFHLKNKITSNPTEGHLISRTNGIKVISRTFDLKAKIASRCN
jgi:hypothetical protein